MAKYVVRLSAHGNPDLGQDPRRKICRTKISRGGSIEEMQIAVRRYIMDNNLGAGNIAPVDVVDLDTNEVVGSISYNGRFWPGDSLRKKFGFGKD